MVVSIPEGPSSEAKGDGSSDALASHGERFMQMFDDYEPSKGKRKGAGSTTSSSMLSKKMTKKSNSSTAAAAAAAPAQPTTTAGHSTKPNAASAAASSQGAGPRGKKRKLSGASSEIDSIMLRLQNLKPQPALAPGSKSPSTQQSGARSLQRPDPRLERRAFMSSKAEKVHASVEDTEPANGGRIKYRGRLATAVDEEDISNMTAAQFRELALEVERLGASELDKKEKKKWKDQLLIRLGGKLEKGPRMGSKIGTGIAKKKAVRDARALEEAMQAGNVKRKGRGKKIREEKAKTRDKGLMESGSDFRNGVLRVKKGGQSSSASGGDEYRSPSSTKSGGGKKKGGGKVGKSGKKWRN